MRSGGRVGPWLGIAAALRDWAAAAATAVICLFSMLGGGHAEDQLRIITSGNYPPFVYSDASGQLSGFEIDFANALCTVLAMRCQFIEMPFEQAIPALVVGSGDAIVASMSITEERKKLVAFTDRYYRTPIQFVASRGFNRPVTAEGLGGLRIGVERATTSEAYLGSRFGDGSRIVGFGRQIDVNQALIDGRVDVMVGDFFALWKFLKSTAGQTFVAVGAPIYVDEGIGIAVRPDEEALRRRLNLAIARLRLDGTYAKINARYFPFSIY